MRILHVGNHVLTPPLRRVGHEVTDAFVEHADLAVPGRPFDVRALWTRLPVPPDLLLVSDTLNHQALPWGVEDVPVPRVYYAMDVHVNFFWQRHYARLFDLALVAHKDWVPLFAADGVPARWLPLAVPEEEYHDLGLARVHDVAFVGADDPLRRPKRAALLRAIGERFRLATFGGTGDAKLTWQEVGRVFSSAKIVVNETVLGDLNLRVFEAMACGALVLTEDTGNGLRDLFTPGLHLDVYRPDDVMEKIAYWLAADEERVRVGAAAARLVAERHTLTARMRELDGILAAGVPRRRVTDAALAYGTAAEWAAIRGLVDPTTGVAAAAAHLRTAFDAGSAEAAIGLAEVLACAGRDGAALAALDEARRRDPTLLLGWTLASELARRGGRLDQAATLLRGGVEAARGVAPATRARALAAIDAGVGDARCLHALAAVLREEGHPLVLGLHRTLDSGLPRTTYEYLERAVRADPSARDVLADGAALLEWLGLPEFALRWYERLVALAPDDAGARAGLVGALRACHRRAEAAMVAAGATPRRPGAAPPSPAAHEPASG